MSAKIHNPRPPSIEEIKHRRKPVRDINAEHAKKLSGLERLAVWITDHVGTMGFFIIIFVWTLIWLGWNLLAPPALRFDPPSGFVFWLFISNMIQLFLMPLIMIGQNLQARHAELRAENDYQINQKAEREIEVLLHHLEYQNTLLRALGEKAGLELENGAAPSPPPTPKK